ncbi:hypothetical protein CkaCkLH20_04888 [Colletotrichum karsti]|uniref:Rhodopsin domain-containing protein n=1 Tax=Colletotrichum karsti TaxID=1095194 RepID=A0A9P6LLG9_9PEZI|nr:uncharacterized protein CkaCkLH20_04888 [Colletotrichum karsti]KAF9877753.1 hypothetical protein CkaCkLH20_04888 [Colletotrichum karsti]
MVTISVRWGNGQHFTELDLEQKQNTIKWMIAAYVPGIETLGFPKLAVIALLSRLLAPGKTHLLILWTMGTICCLSLTAMVLTLLLQCTPPRALWTLSMPHNCLHPEVLEGLAFWASSFSAFLDFYLAVYPAVVLWKLQMHAKKKMALTCALGMGVVSGCVGIVKSTGVPTLSSQDVSYDLCDPFYWTSIEGNLIIIAACIPILQPLLEMFKGRTIWSTDKKSSGRQYEDYSKQSAQQHPDPIELRSKPRKKVDTYGLTIRDKDGSEESIVHPDKRSATASSSRNSGTDHAGDENIVKSSTVTVTYDQGEEGPTSAATRWAAV